MLLFEMTVIMLPLLEAENHARKKNSPKLSNWRYMFSCQHHFFSQISSAIHPATL
jgi:hypothetical protein